MVILLSIKFAYIASYMANYWYLGRSSLVKKQLKQMMLQTHAGALERQSSVSIAPISGDPLVAFAFKVAHLSAKQVMVFIRVYSGTLKRRETLYNSATRQRERVGRLVEIQGGDTVEVDTVEAGMLLQCGFLV